MKVIIKKNKCNKHLEKVKASAYLFTAVLNIGVPLAVKSG